MSRPFDPTKLAVWRERFRRFSSSGLSVVRFCAREGVSTASFYHWRKRLRLKDRPRSTTVSPGRPRTGRAGGLGRFRQVAVVADRSPGPPTAPVIRIQLPCGTRIEVDAGHLDAIRTVVGEVMRSPADVQAGIRPC
jgi:hypothetical protein